MAVFFETPVNVFTDDAQLCGTIELREAECKGYAFIPVDEMPLSADELRTIADKLDELNGTPQDNGRYELRS